MANKASDATAFPYRTALQLVIYGIEWTSPVYSSKNLALVAALTSSLAPYIGTEPPSMSAFTSTMLPATSFYGSNLNRLQTVKAAYDPDNYFTNPSGIPPSLVSPSPVPPDPENVPAPVNYLTPPSAPASSSGGASTAAIVGGVVGGIVVAGLIGALTYFLISKKKKASQQNSLESGNVGSLQGVPPTQPDVAMGSNMWRSTSTHAYQGNSAAGGAALQRAACGAPTGAVFPDPLNSRTFNAANDPMLSWIASLPESGSSFPSSAGGSSSTEAAAMEPWLFKYKDISIIHPLGEGSFGKVYLAKWKETPVAIKMLISSSNPTASKAEALSLGSPDLAALRREAGLMASMRHPNIVNFLGLCTYPPCVATEFCQRGSLYTVIRGAVADPDQALNLTWTRRIDMAIDAARGLLYLHSLSPPVVHRDLKSPNLLVMNDWTVKVGDFNLSKLVEDVAPHANQSQTAGLMNPRWISPEVINGEHATQASDVYAFANVLWELLTWDLPFMGVNEFLIMRKVMEGERPAIPPINQLPGMTNGIAPGGLDTYVDLLRRCWVAAPQERPTIQNVLASLEVVKAAAGGS